MISKNLFSNSSILLSKDFPSAIKLAEEIRKSGDLKYYIIEIESSSCTINIKTKVSGFYFRAKNSPVELHGNKAAKDLDEDGQELTTWKTATFKSLGDNLIFENISFFNDREDPHKNGQLVALEVLGNDNLFINCNLISTQDTLFVGPLPDDLVTRYQNFLPDDERYREGNAQNYFDSCTIKGSVDYIFGAGQALFKNCNLINVEDGRDGPFYVAAPSHSLKDPIGFVFYNCHFLHEFSKVKETFLARPWRDYGKAVFIDCSYQEHIAKNGFINWDGTNRTLTARFEEYPLLDSRVSWANRNKSNNHLKEITDFINQYIKENN